MEFNATHPQCPSQPGGAAHLQPHVTAITEPTSHRDQQPRSYAASCNNRSHSDANSTIAFTARPNLTSRPLMNPTACRNELPKRSCAPLRFSSCYPRARHSAGPILAAAFCRVIATTDLWSHRDRQPRSPHTSKTTDHNATLFQRQLSHLFILASQCQPHRKASPFSGEEWQTRDYNQVSPR